MTLGDILVRSKNRLHKYEIIYRDPFDKYYDLFLDADLIKPVKITSVLVLTDNRPRSLIAIAYALRLTKALAANLLAITTGTHQGLIKGEAKGYNIKLNLLRTLSMPPSLEQILETIEEYEVSLVIMHNLYPLVDDVKENSPVPVLIVNVDRFFKSTSLKKESSEQ